jgi:hypothetical protein
VWRDAPSGFYVGETHCCDKVLGKHKFRKMKPCIGAPAVLDLVAPMCEEPGGSTCAVAKPCPAPVCAPACNYENPCCSPGCPVNTVRVQTPECATHLLPCNPCEKKSC